jgi:hypothetical protein
MKKSIPALLAVQRYFLDFLDFFIKKKSPKKIANLFLRHMTHSLFQGHSSFAQNRFGAVKSILLKRKRN